MNFKSIWVLGSTSEIAISLCIELANNGCNKFHLISRKKSDNEFLVQILKQYKDIEITVEEVDLLDKDNNYKYSVKNYDLYLITAGYLGDSNLASFEEEECTKIINTNFLSLIPFIKNIISHDRLIREGALWVFSSVAADRGRPSNYIYGAAKSGLTVFCEGLALKYINSKFKVRVLKAGFIDTRMSKGKAPPFLTTKPKAIAKYLLKTAHNSGVEYLPGWWRYIMIIVQLLPNKLASKL